MTAKPATNVAVIDRQPRSVLVDMSERYGMEPAAFEATLRATVCKGNVGREEFAAFLLVAKEYRLNPLTKEIYAFPAKGGGIQPILSIDGWCRIINEHPMLDGIEFDDILEGGQLVAVTCKLYRKDRSRPSSVTEYMSECRRSTDVWKQWPARMLRHKALIQCARYAFGFSGIVDQDEYERQVEVVTPQRSGVAARLDGPAADEGFNAVRAAADAELIEAAAHDPETGEVTDAVIDPPAPDDDFPGDRPVESAAPKPEASGDYETPAEWFADACRWIADAPDLKTLHALKDDWKATGKALALKAYSKADHEELLSRMDDRAREIEAAAA